MDVSLFDALTGRFADGTRVTSMRGQHQQLKSVISNLDRLFNAQRGSIAHLPAYGLPAINEVYRDMPESIYALRHAIKETVEHYEPRLRHVRVRHRETDEFAMRLVFVLSGRLVGYDERVRLRTTFRSDEAAHVQPWHR